MKILAVEPGSIAEELGIQPGDELLEINGAPARDVLDLRFHEGDEELTLKVAHNGLASQDGPGGQDGRIVADSGPTIYEIEKGPDDPLGIAVEEMKILSCGNDCIFCFVDQNPKGLRNQLYFRDGDYRLSFMYGNYTTMTNAGPATLRRIIEQRLSPQYISVHVTDYEVRRKLMGLKKDDRILEKIRLLHDHGIDMHTQIVLCPGINDGAALEKTVMDLYRFRERIVSLAVVPVGLTDHRMGLAELKSVDRPYAEALLDTIGRWAKKFRKQTGRNFVYASDEFYIVAGRPLPPAREYDGFPQIENGVGIVRHFLGDFRRQAAAFPQKLPKRRLTLVTGELAAGFMAKSVVPRLRRIAGLDVQLCVAENKLFGRHVTVAGLLSGKCVYSAMEQGERGDLVLLPPDTLNADGLFLDDGTPDDLGQRLGVPVMVFDGDWKAVLKRLRRPRAA